MKKILFLLLSLSLILTGCAGKRAFLQEISPEGVQAVSNTMQNDSFIYDAYSNEMFGWGLKKNKNAPPEIPENIKEMMQKYHAIYIDTIPKTLYLTFDEGYENGYTEKILDVLKENDVKAAFFVTGPYLKKEEALIKRMFEEGHIVGNHTVRHPSMPSLDSTEKAAKELTELDEMCFELYGRHMTYFRPPRGEYSEKTLKITEDLGYTNVFWSFAYQDWDVKKQRGTDYAYRQIMEGVHDGAVLLLHAVSKDNAEVLDRVIKELKGMGYHFRSLDEFGKA